MTSLQPEAALDVLVVATKAPWPPVDGGRVVLGYTLEALAELGHRTTLVAPAPAAEHVAVMAALRDVCRPLLVAATPRGQLASAVGGLLLGRPFTVRRHELPAVQERVAELLATGHFDLVLCEQPQALTSAVAARRRGLPIVVRAHNVESRLWRYLAARSRGPRALLLGLEARRVAAWERRALGDVTGVAAISPIDRDDLAAAAGPGTRVEVVPAPFPAHLEATSSALAGQPAVVVLASEWAPAQAAIRELVADWWPAVRRALPAARLHVFGPVAAGFAADGVEWRPPPEDSGAAFPAGAVAMVPSRHPTGVPVKGLEAWARGLPVVASADAAAALAATDGRELLVASDGAGLAAALARLVASPALAAALVTAARSRLATHHQPAAVTARMLALGRPGGAS